ncbi:MAG: hypothetical protein H8E27_10780 [Verrucomicrobia subdivision 3 bacterium]|nr:hypothetical protein [Limisphaerales bacterium]
MGLLCAAGCSTVNQAANSSRKKEPNQVMVEAKFLEDGVLLAAPRTLTVSGEEATIEISQMAKVPGQIDPVKMGTVLTILPEIRAGIIAFRGSCSVNRSAGRSNRLSLKTATFHSREAFFEGTASSGEIKQVEIYHPNGGRLTVTLKFTVTVNLKQQMSLR